MREDDGARHPTPERMLNILKCSIDTIYYLRSTSAFCTTWSESRDCRCSLASCLHIMKTPAILQGKIMLGADRSPLKYEAWNSWQHGVLAKEATPMKKGMTESPVYENTKHQVRAVQWGGHRNSGDSGQQVAGEQLKCHYHSGAAITCRHQQLDTL